MPRFSIQDLVRIIDRKNKSAAYIFAFLRATIEIIQKQKYCLLSHEDNIVTHPRGSLILKCARYYYPIIDRNPDDPTGGVRHVIPGKEMY
jgi:hypothetical protein